VLPKEIGSFRGVDVASVSAGHRHALALTYNGDVYSWGEDPPYLGHGTLSSLETELDDVLILLPKRIDALRGMRVRCIAAGKLHSCAVTDEGHVYTWGEGCTGALGHMGFEDEPLPKRVETLHDNEVFAVGVAAGGDHTLVADADGTVWGFGYLNAIGAWNDPTVKAMREAEDSSEEGDLGLFGESGDRDLEDGHLASKEEQHARDDCFNFLYPRGRASICMPVRIPVNVRV
jgi:alpha-tubulin suppressor-like RCC1 family protein